MHANREAGPRSGIQGRAMRLLATALLLGTALVVVTAIIHSLSTSSPSSIFSVPAKYKANATTRGHHRSTFIWISGTVLLLAWTVLGIVHSSSRVRARIITHNQAHHATILTCLYAALAASALGLGAYGLWTCSGSNRQTELDSRTNSNPSPGLHPDVTTAVEPLWLKATAATTAIAWLCVAAGLLTLTLVTAVRDIHPDQEAPPTLLLLRCACCSRAVQRIALALPFASLAGVSGMLWRQAATTTDDACAAGLDLLLGSTIIFGSLVLALGIATVIPIVWRRPLTNMTHARRRVCHTVVFCVLMAFGMAAIAWVVKSWRWLDAYDQKTLVDCHVNEFTVRAVRFTTGALLTAGVLMLAMTSCCRLERHLLPTSALPQIDQSMLSPHAIRPPALTKSPHNQDVV